MEIELTLSIKAKATDTLADIRSKLSETSGLFLVNNEPIHQESQVDCESIINKQIEWKTTQDTIIPPTANPSTESSLNSHQQGSLSGAGDTARADMKHLSENFVKLCSNFDSIDQNRGNKKFVVVFYDQSGTQTQKYINAATFEEAFALVRQDNDIDKSKSPLIIPLDRKLEQSASSTGFGK